MNSCTFAGRLGRTPELRSTQAGKTVCSFSLAVRRPFSKETDWFDFVAWGNDATFLTQYAKKGDYVIARGRLQKRSYESKNGTPMAAWEIVCDTVELAGSASKAEPEATAQEEDQFAYMKPTEASDDLPF